MNIRALTVAFAFPVMFVLYSPVPARADDCKPLTLITSLDMVPVTNDAAVIVTAKIDGNDERMLLDTGGFFSTISDKTAAALNLDTRTTGLQMIGVSGHTTNVAARARSFALGRLQASNIDFMIDKDQGGWKNEIDGIIAPNLLTRYDVELDFAAHKVNLLSQDHCQGKVIYWPADAMTVVPIRVAKSGHIVVPVELDGVKMDALIDTGATNTALSQRIAESDFGLKLNTPDTPDIGALSGSPHSRIYRHRFKKLTIGGIGAGNPPVVIVPDLMNNKLSHGPPIGTRFSQDDEASRLPDLIVGMDILHRLHIYIAYKEENLYVTPATPPATASNSTTAQRGGTGQ